MSEKLLNLPTSFVAPELSAILCFWLFAVFAVRCNQLNALYRKLGVQWVAVIRLIPDQSFRPTLDMSRCESLVYQFDLMR